MASVQTECSTHAHFWPQISPACVGFVVSATTAGLSSGVPFVIQLVFLPSTFLPSFAPPPLPGFLATMKALTSGWLTCLTLQPDLPDSVSQPSSHSVSNHPLSPSIALSRYPSARWASRSLVRVWASPVPSRLTGSAGRIEFTMCYGLRVHLLLLPTFPLGNAVTVGFKPESVCLERTFTALAVYLSGALGGGFPPAVLPHHRTYGSVYGGS